MTKKSIETEIAEALGKEANRTSELTKQVRIIQRNKKEATDEREAINKQLKNIYLALQISIRKFNDYKEKGAVFLRQIAIQKEKKSLFWMNLWPVKYYQLLSILKTKYALPAHIKNPSVLCDILNREYIASNQNISNVRSEIIKTRSRVMALETEESECLELLKKYCVKREGDKEEALGTSNKDIIHYVDRVCGFISADVNLIKRSEQVIQAQQLMLKTLRNKNDDFFLYNDQLRRENLLLNEMKCELVQNLKEKESSNSALKDKIEAEKEATEILRAKISEMEQDLHNALEKHEELKRIEQAILLELESEATVPIDTLVEDAKLSKKIRQFSQRSQCKRSRWLKCFHCCCGCSG